MSVVEKEKSALTAEEIEEMYGKIQQNKNEDVGFAESLDKYLANPETEISPLKLGITPNSLTISGANPDLQVVINPSTIKKCMSEANEHYHGHGLSEEIMKQLSSELRNPTMIFKGSKEDSLVAITELKDKENHGVIVAVSLSEKHGFSEVNRISSAYGKNNLSNYLRNQMEKGNLLAANKEKADKMLHSIGLQLPRENTFISFDNSIAYTTANVKYPSTKNKSENVEIAVGDKILYESEEYTITSLESDVPNSIQISQKGVDGLEYTYHIDKDKLLSDSSFKYLGQNEDKRYQEVNSMEKQAIYKFVENGQRQYAYAHWGANVATGSVRYVEACQIAEEYQVSRTDAMLNITYDGEYKPFENNGNKVFNKLTYDHFGDLFDTAAHGIMFAAKVTIDSDHDIFKYQQEGQRDICIPLSKAAEITSEEIAKCEGSSEKWSIYELSQTLQHRYYEIQNQYDYLMDIVVVQPGLPAEHKTIDISDGKLRAMQNVVQGLIEPIYSISEPGMIVFANEEARILEFEPNRRIPGEQPVCGTFFICGDTGDDSCSLTPEQVTKYVEKYKTPDVFSEAEIKQAHECQIYFHSFSDEEDLSSFLGFTKTGGRK